MWVVDLNGKVWGSGFWVWGLGSDWSQSQVRLNSARGRSWSKFTDWVAIEHKRGVASKNQQKSKRAKIRPKRVRKDGKMPALLEEWGEGEVPWDQIVPQGRLGELSIRELLLYFREFHVTVPPTRIEMQRSIRSHHFFFHRNLEHQKARLYRPQD